MKVSTLKKLNKVTKIVEIETSIDEFSDEIINYIIENIDIFPIEQLQNLKIKLETFLDNLPKTSQEKQKDGLKKHLGNEFGKFTYAGSILRWEFSWNTLHNNNKINKQDGYDNGRLKNDNDLFKSLETRFIKSVIFNNKYYEKANNFKVFLCSGQGRTYDNELFSLSFLPIGEGKKMLFKPNVFFSEFSKKNFSEISLDYILSLFENLYMQIKNRNENSTIDALVTDMNSKVASVKEPTLKEIYKKTLETVFDGKSDFIKPFLLATPKINDTTLILIFPKEIINLMNEIAETYKDSIQEIAQLCGCEYAEVICET